MSERDFLRKEFTEVGELTEDSDGGLSIRLTFGKPLSRVLRQAGLIGKPLEVSFKLLRYQRSAAQNRYLWGAAYTTIAAWFKETQGEAISKDAIHAHTLRHILDYVPVVEDIFGEEVIVMKGKSTSSLNTKEFGEMVEKLQAYWAERGCLIPEPRKFNFLSEFLKYDE